MRKYDEEEVSGVSILLFLDFAACDSRSRPHSHHCHVVQRVPGLCLTDSGWVRGTCEEVHHLMIA